MSKVRTAGRYTAAGLLTGAYVAATARVMQQTRREQTTSPVSKQQVAIAGILVVGLTWVAALL